MHYPATQLDYQFTGFLDELYATQVVRLHASDVIAQDELLRSASDFKMSFGRSADA